MDKIDFVSIDNLLLLLCHDVNLLKDKVNIKTLEEEINIVEFSLSELSWDDPVVMSSKMKRLTSLKSKYKLFSDIFSHYDYLKEMLEFAKESKDENIIVELKGEIISLSHTIDREKTNLLFSQKDDELGCYLEIHAGSGGVDAQDFAGMLLRMYTRFVEDMKFSVKTLEYNSSAEAKNGIKSVILKIEGLYAYGFLKIEEGVHRLVRQSPFNADGKRHTSFVAVDAYPLGDDVEINILDKDLKIDTFRASGAGGQHVNTTDSAVRITHIPTGIVVQCQSERSQHKNKSTALSLLKSRLLKMESLNKQNIKYSEYESKKSIGFGNQIRSYILHPYLMVKDHRSNFETQNPKAILDGELYNIILSVLSISSN